MKYILSILATLGIIIISVIPIPEVPPVEKIPLWDKWVHFLMYGGLCSVYWFDYLRHGHSRRAYVKWMLLIVAAPVALGGILELAQSYLTTCRNGDWIDFIANSVGVLLAIPIGLFLIPRFLSK